MEQTAPPDSALGSPWALSHAHKLPDPVPGVGQGVGCQLWVLAGLAEGLGQEGARGGGTGVPGPAGWQRQVVTQDTVQDSQGSTVWRGGGCSQGRFWGEWWVGGSQLVTQEPPKPEAIRKGGRWKGEAAAGFFPVARGRMGTDGTGQQPVGMARAPGQLWSQSTGSSTTFGARELTAAPLFPAPLIPSLLGGSLLLSRIKYIPGVCQLCRQRNPAPLKGFSLSSFHSLKE